MKAKKKRARLSALIAILQKDQDQYGDPWVTFTLSADMLAQSGGTPTAAVRRFSGQYTIGGTRAAIEESAEWGQIRMEFE